jgi:hypothetical protein
MFQTTITKLYIQKGQLFYHHQNVEPLNYTPMYLHAYICIFIAI